MTRIKNIYCKDGKWYNVTDYDTCCCCGTIHKVEYKIVNGKIKRRSWNQGELSTKELDYERGFEDGYNISKRNYKIIVGNVKSENISYPINNITST